MKIKHVPNDFIRKCTLHNSHWRAYSAKYSKEHLNPENSISSLNNAGLPRQTGARIWLHREALTAALEALTHQRLTRKGCSRPCMIWSSRKTFRTSSLSMHFCLFMYFIAYIFLVSRFCTMHTWVTVRGENVQTDTSKEQKGQPLTASPLLGSRLGSKILVWEQRWLCHSPSTLAPWKSWIRFTCWSGIHTVHIGIPWWLSGKESARQCRRHGLDPWFGKVPWSETESRSVLSDSLRPHGLYSPGNSPGQNTGVGSLSLLHGIFPTQGSNPSLLHCRQILYQLSHKGSPRIPAWVAYPFSNGSSQPRNQTGVSCMAGKFFTNWAIREALPWSRTWQPTPEFLPGESHGQRSLVGYSPRGRKESDTA